MKGKNMQSLTCESNSLLDSQSHDMEQRDLDRVQPWSMLS